MATSTSPVATPSGLISYNNTDVDETEDAVVGASSTIYSLVLDNTANAAATYFKAYNSGSVTVGTTAPDMIIEVPASTSTTIPFPFGYAGFDSALTIAAVTAGGTAGTTGPTSAFKVSVVYA